PNAAAPRQNTQSQIQNASNPNSGTPAASPKPTPKKLDNTTLIEVKSSGSSPQNNQYQEQQPETQLNSGAGEGANPNGKEDGKEKELKEGTVVGPENPVLPATVRMGVETEETRRKREQMRKDFDTQQKREIEEAKAARTKPQANPQPSDFGGVTPNVGKVERALPTALNNNRKVSFTLSPAPVRQQIGKNFNMTVEANGQGEMVGANLAIRFDEKKLQVKNVRGGELFGQQPKLSFEVKNGVLTLQVNSAINTPFSTKGSVIVIEFAAIGEGESQVGFNNSDTKVNLADKKSAPASGATVQVVITRDAVTSSNQ
ncbi:MAG: cohesin domain-containing protein, partial [Blastocatellia bacterium]